MFPKYFVPIFLCCVSSFLVKGTTSQQNNVTVTAEEHPYDHLIRISLLFYEAQRSGVLPPTNRIAYRGNSFLDDGQDNGLDLSGGYFDGKTR